MSGANRIKRGNMLALDEHEMLADAVRSAHHILRIGVSIDAVRFAHHILPAAVTPAYAGTSLRGAQRRGNPEKLFESKPWIASLRSQ